MKLDFNSLRLRLTAGVEMMSRMGSQEEAISEAIKNFKVNNALLWVEGLDNQVLAKSNTLMNSSNSEKNQLIAFTKVRIKPKVIQINNRYYVLCSDELSIKGDVIGRILVAQDITRDQTMFVAMMQGVVVTSVLVIVVMAVAIAVYIQRSLKPLRQLSQMTEVISADDLGKAHLYLD